MDVGIIGAGSIGMLIGSYIAESGLTVRMLVRGERQREQLMEKGLCRINGDGTKLLTAVQATTAYTAMTQVKLLIIAVKYKDLADVLARLKSEDCKVPILFVQNGIGHLDAIREIDFPNVAFSTVEHGALKQSNTIVKHNGVGNITIAVAFGQKDVFQLLEKSDRQQFPIRWEEDAAHILLRKALMNCLINPLTTILHVPNGELVKNIHSHLLMKSLYEELIEVFPEIERELSFEMVEGVCLKTAQNHSSMLTDYQNGRPMEIDTIVSAVIAKAALRGKSLPLLQTYERLLLVLDEKAMKGC